MSRQRWIESNNFWWLLAAEKLLVLLQKNTAEIIDKSKNENK
jgi:hypothetical protein